MTLSQALRTVLPVCRAGREVGDCITPFLQICKHRRRSVFFDWVRITTNPRVCGGKACVAGSRIRVQDVYVWHEMQGLSADEIVSRFPQLTMADVYAALSYYWDHRDEIQRQMASDQDLVESMKRQFGSPLREKLRGVGIDAPDDSLPSG